MGGDDREGGLHAPHLSVIPAKAGIQSGFFARAGARDGLPLDPRFRGNDCGG
jgi:hypothetical protein